MKNIFKKTAIMAANILHYVVENPPITRANRPPTQYFLTTKPLTKINFA